MMLRVLLALIVLMVSSPALAWWEYGHHTVAEIAERTVRPAARAEIARLIRRSALLETPECPVRTLAEAAYWPDCVRRYKERFSYSFPWHYQNVDVCKPFDQASACRDGNCVSAQIERNAKLLADAKLPDRERLIALAFLAHFVGDLHMPLHAGDRGDKGGNDFAASYGLIGGRANLHSIWDGYLAERGISTPQGGTAGLLAEFGAQRSALMAGSITDWARESWEASRTFAYGSVMTDPCGAKPATRPVIDEATTRRLIPSVRLQIARGGMRLGRLLDEAFS